MSPLLCVTREWVTWSPEALGKVCQAKGLFLGMAVVAPPARAAARELPGRT
jgi:hypothetical protein